jgi:Cu/Ag efflux protein CusF
MTKLLRAASAVFAMASILAAGSAFAHHSTAMFNMRKNVTLTGTIRRFDWQNPHTWIVFDVMNEKGGVEQYGIEGMSPNYLVRNGWTMNTLKPGDKVEITIHPLRNGEKGGFDVSVKFPSGKVMYNLPHGPP